MRLVVSSGGLPVPAEARTLAEKAADYARQARAANTLRAYAADWRHWMAWCAALGLAALPATPESLGLYLSDQAGRYKAATLCRRLSAIREAHRMAGQPLDTDHPAVRDVWRGIRAVHGSARHGKTPALTGDLTAMLAVLPAGPAGVRNRALLLLGFAAALRRSELVGLDLGPGQTAEGTGWIAFEREGLAVHLVRSKSDRLGEGRRIGVPFGTGVDTCPVAALKAWIQRAGLVHGPIFRGVTRNGRVLASRLSDRTVALVVKQAALAAGFDPARYAGHSLRAGHATSAALASADERLIQRQLGHASPEMTRRYIREADLFDKNSAKLLGL